MRLDGTAADLAVALGEVDVAERQQRAGHVDGQKQRRAGADLHHVEVATELAWRNRADTGRGVRLVRGCGTIGCWWQGVDGSLALGPVGEALGRGRHTDYANEGVLGDRDPRQASARGGAIVQAPGDEVRVGKAVGE